MADEWVTAAETHWVMDAAGSNQPLCFKSLDFKMQKVIVLSPQKTKG